jgi:hypothetical protein
MAICVADLIQFDNRRPLTTQGSLPDNAAAQQLCHNLRRKIVVKVEELLFNPVPPNHAGKRVGRGIVLGGEHESDIEALSLLRRLQHLRGCEVLDPHHRQSAGDIAKEGPVQLVGSRPGSQDLILRVVPLQIAGGLLV